MPADHCKPSEAVISAARHGDENAWSVLVERYQPLITYVIGRHRILDSDAADVSQIVWLRVFERLQQLRDPAALSGWIGSITTRACVEHFRTAPRVVPVDTHEGSETHPCWGRDETGGVDEHLLQWERRGAVRQSVAELPFRYRALMQLLLNDPPLAYGEISARLGVPIGSIGPTRARCLTRLRRSAPIASLA
ncbi:MAG TPA: sigma-70 family RNA polymerase sigma factor [Microlunatus sp.]